ncbi:MAG TPA: diphosphomevalonate decarboxylase [Thermoplasmata archaeon]|nr:diphosphomevalonate decarboxylase [Thermoplasmata archaeon]
MADPRRRRRRTATAIAAPNIALVKYWGQRDERLRLPYNSSLSVTLGGIRTRTTVRFDPGFARDRLSLNGRWVTGPPLDAVRKFLDRVRELSAEPEHAEVVSANNFPTASGLASSASGFAALAGAAAWAAGVDATPADLSRLARVGSGSAARSIFGGFVVWDKGQRADGLDSVARPLFGPTHWPELVDLVVVIRGAPDKPIRSADAMQRSVATSPRFAGRQRAVPPRLERMERAIAERDAERLFPEVMEECDDFRAVCETTRPPLDYLTPASRAVLDAVRTVNREAGHPVAAYTHDAGAHVHVFTLAEDAATVRAALAAVAGVERILSLRPGPGLHRAGRSAAA